MNRNKRVPWSLLLTIVFGVVGCAPVYVPTAPMVFQSEEKGDFMVSFRQGFHSSNIQAGLAVSDHINLGIYAARQFTADATSSSTVYRGTRAFTGGLAIGYYSRFTSKHTFELNGGFRAATFQVPEEISGFYSAFIQPSFTFKAGQEGRSHFTILTRAVGMTFLDSEDGLDTTITQSFLEPMISWSLGNAIKFQTQLGLSVPMAAGAYGGAASPFVWNIGLSYRLPARRKGVLGLPHML